MSRRRELVGRYLLANGEFTEDASMKEIRERVARMSLLFDSAAVASTFHFDPEDNSYWEFTEFQDYLAVLREVDRAYIRSRFPTETSPNRLNYPLMRRLDAAIANGSHSAPQHE